jgi:hypothetical protein
MIAGVLLALRGNFPPSAAAETKRFTCGRRPTSNSPYCVSPGFREIRDNQRNTNMTTAILVVLVGSFLLGVKFTVDVVKQRRRKVHISS